MFSRMFHHRAHTSCAYLRTPNLKYRRFELCLHIFLSIHCTFFFLRNWGSNDACSEASCWILYSAELPVKFRRHQKGNKAEYREIGEQFVAIRRKSERIVLLQPGACTHFCSYAPRSI